MSYFYIFLTIILTVYGQIAIKWQVLKAGALPDALPDKAAFLFNLLLNPWVISAFAADLLASVFWMATMAKLQLSHAYPFMSLAFSVNPDGKWVIFPRTDHPTKNCRDNAYRSRHHRW